MNKRISSEELYEELLERKKYLLGSTTPEELCELLRLVVDELLTDFSSPFLDRCYTAWKAYCSRYRLDDLSYTPRAFRLTQREYPGGVSSYDALITLRFLAGKESVCNYERLSAWAKEFCGSFDYPNPHSNEGDTCLEMLDSRLLDRHNDAFSAYMALKAGNTEESELAAQIVQRARAEASAIIAKAEIEAASLCAEGEMLRAKGEEAAKRVYREAIAETAKVHGSKQEQRETDADKKLEQGFNTVKEKFGEIAAAIQSLEETVENERLFAIFRDYYSLYSLVNQNKNALMENGNDSVRFMADNLQVYLDSISENLAALGISTVISSKGTAFNGKLHDECTGKAFDPTTATVAKSLCAGFVLEKDGRVLKAEKIAV